VTIARAIANNPSILLLDEPTGDLDTRSTDIVMKILLDLNIEKKITMIMVTHDIGLKTFANKVVKMADGKVNSIVEIDPFER
jgi:putative ABC transport system ATP-binding protein